MSSPAEDIATVVKAACSAVMSPDAAYAPGEVVRLVAKPLRYAEVTAERRTGTENRLDPGPDMGFWIVMVEAVADTENNARTLLADASAALDYRQLAVGGKATSPLIFQEGRAVAFDGAQLGTWSGLNAWNFTL